MSKNSKLIPNLRISDDSLFQTLILKDKNYEKIKNTVINEDNLTYHVLGPFYGANNDWIFIDIAMKQSDTVAVGTSASPDIDLNISKYDAKNISQVVPIHLSKDNAYYIIIGSTDINSIEGQIYIPLNEQNSTDITLNSILYADLDKFRLIEETWDDIDSIFVKNITCKVEYKRADDDKIRIKYNPSYYQVTAQQNESELNVSISCLADDSVNSRVCSNAICYIPDSVAIDLESSLSLIKIDYCPNVNIKGNFDTLIIEGFQSDKIKMYMNTIKSNILLPDVMNDYIGQEEYLYDVNNPIINMNLDLESCSFVLK